MIFTERQMKLLDFVKDAHAGQLRKYTFEPYWTHPYAVALLVSPYDDGENMLIEIALLHDVLEDTQVDSSGLNISVYDLGYTVLESARIVYGVKQLTDNFTKDAYPDLNRWERKAREAERLGKAPQSSQTVKYADLIHNTQSIVKHDKGFAKKYLAEKRYLLNLMRMGHLDLFMECYKTLVEAEDKLKLDGYEITT